MKESAIAHCCGRKRVIKHVHTRARTRRPTTRWYYAALPVHTLGIPGRSRPWGDELPCLRLQQAWATSGSIATAATLASLSLPHTALNSTSALEAAQQRFGSCVWKASPSELPRHLRCPRHGYSGFLRCPTLLAQAEPHPPPTPLAVAPRPGIQLAMCHENATSRIICEAKPRTLPPAAFLPDGQFKMHRKNALSPQAKPSQAKPSHAPFL